ncbi:MAG TPA: S9 family peptidase [Burkholderiaceae bacterium]|nr:S9 family peptidase [Burkholderiaceae bacterium]
MTPTRSALALAAALTAGCAATTAPPPAADAPPAAVPPVYPLKDFFRSSPKAFFRLSEDGQTLSFMQPTGEARRRNIFVQSLAGGQPQGEPKRLTDETARDIGSYFWKGNRTILYQKDFGGDENFHVVAVDAQTAKVTDLTPYPGARASVEDDLPDDPRHVIVSHNRRDKKVFDLFRVDVQSGESTLIAENPGDVVGWQTDHQGRVRIAASVEGVTSLLKYRDGATGDFKTIITTDYKTEVQPLFFTFDDKKFYALSNRGRDKKALVIIDPAKPDAEELVYQHPDVDLASAGYSRLRRVLTQAEFQTDKTGHRFFDPATEALWARIQAKLPGYEITLQSQSLAEDRFIVAALNDRTPGTRYVYDAKADTLSKLSDINPWIPESGAAAMKPIVYAARDGLKINGYLTLPAGRAPKNLACIVNPHGGPWARDAWGYNPEVQFLANRGYCVLQMNFRGSTGYGRAFWEASFGQWGLKMQDDVTDGVQWLIRQGIADPKRVGIYGGSYGGYATLAGVTYTPDLYAAAVDYVGVSNLLTFMKTIPPYWTLELDKMYAMVGNPERDKARLEATSPALHADRIKTPLLIAQGARDPRVNKAESDQVVEALKQRGVQVEYLVKDNEGHGFQNEENQFEFYAAMERFFGQHLKP